MDPFDPYFGGPPGFPFYPMDPFSPFWFLYWGDFGDVSKPLPPRKPRNDEINVSSFERNTECSLIDQKVKVKGEGLPSFVPLNKVLASVSDSKDRFVQYDRIQGMTFKVPYCPCYEQSFEAYAMVTVNSKKQFQELKDEFQRMGYMEQSVCWRNGTPASPEEAPASEPPPSNEDSFEQLLALNDALAESFDPGENCYAYDEDLGQLLCEEDPEENTLESGLKNLLSSALGLSSLQAVGEQMMVASISFLEGASMRVGMGAIESQLSELGDFAFPYPDIEESEDSEYFEPPEEEEEPEYPSDE